MNLSAITGIYPTSITESINLNPESLLARVSSAVSEEDKEYHAKGRSQDRMLLQLVQRNCMDSVEQSQRLELEEILSLAKEVSASIGLNSFQSYFIETGAAVLYSLGEGKEHENKFSDKISSLRRISSRSPVPLKTPEFLETTIYDALALRDTSDPSVNFSNDRFDDTARIITAVYQIQSMKKNGLDSYSAAAELYDHATNPFIRNVMERYLARLDESLIKEHYHNMLEQSSQRSAPMTFEKYSRQTAH